MAKEEFKSRVVVNWSTIPITKENQQWKAECGDVVIQNKGTSICLVDQQFRLLPGQTMVDGCNWNEVNTHSYRFNFTGGGTNAVVIRCKNLPKD